MMEKTWDNKDTGNMDPRTDKNWRSDPRLHNMAAAKIALLASFADELSKTPEHQKLQAFLTLNQKMQKASISFSARERELLFDVLMESLSPSERQKAGMIRRLAGRFQN